VCPPMTTMGMEVLLLAPSLLALTIHRCRMAVSGLVALRFRKEAKQFVQQARALIGIKNELSVG
jgi:hypothetical protein